MRPSSSLCVRRISAAPGRKASSEPLLRPHRAHDRVGHLRLDRPRVAADIARLDRKSAASALDDRRVAEQRRDARAVDGRRHDEKLQILAQALLRVARQRKAKVGVERALVELVEQHCGDAVERRIVENHAGENAFGDDFDAVSRRHLRAKAHAKADLAADPLAERRRHALGGGARGEPPRLQHQDAFPLRPGLTCEHKRYPRGLAGAGRSDQHGRIVIA